MQPEEMKKRLEVRLKHHLIDLFFKRIFDIVVSMISIVILLPFMLIIVAVIVIDSKGGAIFTQKRVGLNGVPFTIYKFRTMVKDAQKMLKLDIDKDNLGKLVFQDKNDARVTHIGGFLRRTSLDELPQLFNVLIGNMSLVGPRPEIPEVADLYNDMQKIRLMVKPGITGLAQVSGRGEIELERTIQYDLEYISNFALWLDIKILFRTATIVFKREGAF